MDAEGGGLYFGWSSHNLLSRSEGISEEVDEAGVAAFGEESDFSRRFTSSVDMLAIFVVLAILDDALSMVEDSVRVSIMSPFSPKTPRNYVQTLEEGFHGL